MDKQRTELDVLQIENLQLRLASDLQDLIIAQVSKKYHRLGNLKNGVDEDKNVNSAPMPARNDST